MSDDEVGRLEVALATLGTKVNSLAEGFTEMKGEVKTELKSLRELLADHAEFITIFKKKCEDDEKAAGRRWAVTLSVITVLLGVIAYAIKDLMKSLIMLLGRS